MAGHMCVIRRHPFTLWRLCIALARVAEAPSLPASEQPGIARYRVVLGSNFIPKQRVITLRM
jgi:hypothetical protein